MATEEEWDVPNSDDERDETLTWTANGGHDIPLQILEYYEEIDKNKVLELQVKEYRKPVPTDSDKDKAEEEGDSAEHKKKDPEIIADSDRKDAEEEESRETIKRSTKLQSEFDEFDEPEECQGHIPKRTPKSGRLPKKRVGTLKNVISNLKRFREMDNSISEDIKPESSNEVKEDKNTEDITADASNT